MATGRDTVDGVADVAGADATGVDDVDDVDAAVGAAAVFVLAAFEFVLEVAFALAACCPNTPIIPDISCANEFASICGVAVAVAGVVVDDDDVDELDVAGAVDDCVTEPVNAGVPAGTVAADAVTDVVDAGCCACG